MLFEALRQFLIGHVRALQFTGVLIMPVAGRKSASGKFAPPYSNWATTKPAHGPQAVEDAQPRAASRTRRLPYSSLATSTPRVCAAHQHRDRRNVNAEQIDIREPHEGAEWRRHRPCDVPHERESERSGAI